MHTKLGRVVATLVIGAVVIGAALAAVGAAAAGAATGGTTPTSSTTTASSSTTATSTTATSTTTTSTTTTSTTTTSTTVPATAAPLVGDVEAAPTTVPAAPPLVVDVPAPPEVPEPLTPERGDQRQVTDTLPPPPTTTTLPPDALPADSGTGRRVVYSKSQMRVWTVEADGHVSRTYLVSGRRTWNQPSPGTYSVFSRSTHTCNIRNPNLCWQYMVRFTRGPEGDNIGFHQIPIDTRTGRAVQSEAQLGQALSGGCVRQAPVDAVYMWGWAPVGTKVVVLG